MKIIRNADLNTKEVDFLFIYEVKAREMESLGLLVYELEKRGYRVGIVSFWDGDTECNRDKLKTNVLITSSVYKEPSLYRALARAKGKCKVVNLQWEQVYCMRDIANVKSPWKMMGKTREINHISWGNQNMERLIYDDGVSKELVHKAGHIGLDFLRKEFVGYYLSKEQLLEQYHINTENKICLFISSFSFVKLPTNCFEEELIDFAENSLASQKAVLEWIERLLNEDKEITFIYRPHPAEADNEVLHRMEKKCSRFKVISDFSIKQWILVVDIIYNWWSTSIAEIFFANKTCFILRPYKVPETFEITIFKDGKFIETYDDFKKTTEERYTSFPISNQGILENYYVDEAEPTYLKIVKVLEMVYGNDVGYMEYKNNAVSLKKNFKNEVLRSKVGRLLQECKRKMCSKRLLTEEDVRNKEYAEYVSEMKQKNEISENEMERQIVKIRKILEKPDAG